MTSSQNCNVPLQTEEATEPLTKRITERRLLATVGHPHPSGIVHANAKNRQDDCSGQNYLESHQRPLTLQHIRHGARRESNRDDARNQPDTAAPPSAGSSGERNALGEHVQGLHTWRRAWVRQNLHRYRTDIEQADLLGNPRHCTWFVNKHMEKRVGEVLQRREVCFFNHKMAGVRTAQLEKCRVVLASYEIIAVKFGRLGKWEEGAIHRRNEVKGIDAETGKGEGSSKPDRAVIWTLPDIPLIEATFGRVVLDEGHRIRNQGEVQVFKHVMSLKAEYRVVCTGTRLHNSYDDMLAYLLFLIFPWNDEEFFARVR
jgi:hypothetical protein